MQRLHQIDRRVVHLVAQITFFVNDLLIGIIVRMNYERVGFGVMLVRINHNLANCKKEQQQPG